MELKMLIMRSETQEELPGMELGSISKISGKEHQSSNMDGLRTPTELETLKEVQPHLGSQVKLGTQEFRFLFPLSTASANYIPGPSSESISHAKSNDTMYDFYSFI